MDDIFDPFNEPDGPSNSSGITDNFIPDNDGFTLDLFDSLLPNDLNTFDSSVPFDVFGNDPFSPFDVPIYNDPNPLDILGYAGIGLFSVFGYDNLYPYDIYGYDRSVPYDAYGNGGLVGSVSDDRLVGTDGNDVIYGNSGFDIITGEAGNDTLIASSDGGFLSGGSGDDILYAGFGQTFMRGESGRDIFVLSAATATFDPSQTHVLLDMNDTQFDGSNTGDTVNVSNTLSGELVNLLSGAEFNFVVAGTDGRTISANDTVIALDGGGFLGVVVGQTPSEVANHLVIT
jgi:Ca2+-binding RTX toxin-like protein